MKKPDAARKKRSLCIRLDDEFDQRISASARRHAVPKTQIHRWALLRWLDDDEEDQQTSRHRLPGYVAPEEEHGVRVTTARKV